MPAALTFSRISCVVRVVGSTSVPTPSDSVYCPSFTTTMERSVVPSTFSRFSIAFTVPETELIMLADTKPSASAMICPASTLSPFWTSGFAGFPICWFRWKTRSPLGSQVWNGISRANSFPSYGCTPPWNVFLYIWLFLLLYLTQPARNTLLRYGC